MKLNLLDVVTLVALISSNPASAGFHDGNSFLSECDSEKSVSLGVCLGYVEGIVDVITSGEGWFGHKACIPVGVSVGQLRDVVIKYLKDYPEKRHYLAASSVTLAIDKAFPCK